MRVKSIKLQNMFRFADSQIEIPECVSLVLGRNEDSAGADSNGSGKSSMFYALSWCLFKQLPIRLKMEDIKREGTRSALVAVELIEGENVLRVVRRMETGSSDLQIFHNGVPVRRQTNTQLQGYLLQLLGFDSSTSLAFQDFLNTSYLTSETIDTLASSSMGSRERLDFIARALGLSVLDRASASAKDKQAFYTRELELADAHAVVITEEDQAALKRCIETEKVLLAQSELCEIEIKKIRDLGNRQKEIKRNEVAFRGIEQKIAEVAERRRDVLNPLRRHSEKLETRLERVPGIEKELRGARKALSAICEPENPELVMQKRKQVLQNLQGEGIKAKQVFDERKQVATKILATERNLEKCPKCKTPLVRIRGVLLAFEEENFEGTKVAILQEVEEAKIAYSIAAQKAQAYQRIIDVLEKKATQIVLLRSQIFAFEKDIAEMGGLREQIEKARMEEKQQDAKFMALLKSLKHEKGELEELIQQAYAKEPDLRLDVSDTLIKATNQLIQYRVQLQKDKLERFQLEGKATAAAEYKSRREKSLLEEEEYKGWKEGFLRIRAALIERWIPLLAENTNEILEDLFCGLQVRFTIAPEAHHPTFKIDVIDEEGYSRPYESFSQGEKKRVSIAINLALRRLAFDRGSLTLNFLLLDEIADALDETGTSAFFQVLQKQGCQAMVISHNEQFLAKFSAVIRVVRREGVSDIE